MASATKGATPSFEMLEAAWNAQRAERTGQVRLLVARLGGGVHRTLETAQLCPEKGLVGDRWVKGASPCLGRQVTLMDARVAELVCHGQELHLPGDNILVDLDLAEEVLRVGDELVCGDVRLRITAKPHRGCKVFAERFGLEALKWVNWRHHRGRRLRGVNCQVLSGGSIKVGDRFR